MITLPKIYLTAAASLLSLPAVAQLHEEISVDGKYVPDVIKVERINTFPKMANATLQTSPIGYESRGVAASFSPSLVTLPATGWRASRTVSENPGYLELGLGNLLNSTLSAGYRFVDNSTTLFGIRLQHNSTSLWKPEISLLTKDEKQYRYDESLALYASHVFKGKGRLDAALDYHLGFFNYYGYGAILMPGAMENPDGKRVDVPGQTINDVAFHAMWKPLISPSSTLEWNAGFRLRHFAYRQMLSPLINGSGIYSDKGGRETDIGLEGGIRLPWDNGSSIGLDANLDVLAMPQPDMALYYDSDPFPPSRATVIDGGPSVFPDNYGMLTLTPYYRFSKGLLDIRVGLDLDLAFNAGESGDRYPFLHIAPDINLALQTGQVGLYLTLAGGSQLNTLAYLHQLDYYGLPNVLSTRPTHTPLDASFGVNLGPFSGFSIGLAARYKVMKNVPLGGWYQAYLNYDNKTIPGLTPTTEWSSPGYCGSMSGINLHGASVSAEMKYEYGNVFSASAEGSYQPQDGKKGFFNGYDRPRVTARFNVAFRPIEPLKIGAGYDYRGVRRIYTASYSDPTPGGPVINGDGITLQHLRLPDLTLLNVSASWDFTPSFSVWVEADNLLNRHDCVLPMQPTQGIVGVAGLKWLF